MKKNFAKILICLFITVYSCPALTAVKKDNKKSLSIRHDRKTSGESLPHFRSSKDSYKNSGKHQLARTGLDELNASASGQLSVAEIRSLRKKTSAKNLVLVDLRQEFHAFLDGAPVQIKKGPKAHLPDDVISREKQYIAQLLSEARLATKNIKRTETSLNMVSSELETAQKHGIKSVRLPVAAGQVPSHAIVDSFVTLVDNLDDDAWIHFHCKQGNGRATTGFIMYDMLRNAHKVDRDTIIKRHAALGGADIEKKPKYAEHRKFLASFYNFARAKHAQPSLIWSRFKDKNAQ
jgi:protein tyrosine phosphatase (PTP) superfamily phosphohydrolase (DUF442 family)